MTEYIFSLIKTLQEKYPERGGINVEFDIRKGFQEVNYVVFLDGVHEFDDLVGIQHSTRQTH